MILRSSGLAQPLVLLRVFPVVFVLSSTLLFPTVFKPLPALDVLFPCAGAAATATLCLGASPTCSSSHPKHTANNPCKQPGCGSRSSVSAVTQGQENAPCAEQQLKLCHLRRGAGQRSKCEGQRLGPCRRHHWGICASCCSPSTRRAEVWTRAPGRTCSSSLGFMCLDQGRAGALITAPPARTRCRARGVECSV